jgi:hypothetical protein
VEQKGVGKSTNEVLMAQERQLLLLLLTAVMKDSF